MPATTTDKPTDLGGRAFHLIGVGGAGMSVLAQLLAERGATVTGSDAVGGDAFDHNPQFVLNIFLLFL